MISLKIASLVIIAGLFSIQGCSFFRGNKDKFTVNIKFAAENNRQKLEDVRVIIGSDKFWWNSIESGKEESVNLYAEKDAVNNVTLLFKIGGKEMSWESESFIENADHRVDLMIDKDGKVTNVICKLPC